MTDENRNWQLYGHLLDLMKHQHSRWIDNYRIFLLFNSIFLPAITGVAAYTLTHSDDDLYFIVIALALLGIGVALVQAAFMLRIRLDTDLGFAQIRKVEEALGNIPVKPYYQGHRYFKEHYNLTIEGEGIEFTHPIYGDGLRAITTYNLITGAIILIYVLLLIYVFSSK